MEKKEKFHKVCAWCGREFEANIEDKIFCSITCVNNNFKRYKSSFLMADPSLKIWDIETTDGYVSHVNMFLGF